MRAIFCRDAVSRMAPTRSVGPPARQRNHEHTRIVEGKGAGDKSQTQSHFAEARLSALRSSSCLCAPNFQIKKTKMATDLKHYLEYYGTLHSPGYAVMVTGDWGIGKTHQVKNCLSPTDYLYVSLFGLQSVDAIRLAVMSKLTVTTVDSSQTSLTRFIPVLEDVITNLKRYKPLGRLTQGVAESLLSEKLRERYVIVFDDLERSSLKIQDLLGILNHYIEDMRFRVIIISNEQELKPEFATFKEKLIGQTIQVVPQLSEAYDAFVTELNTSESRSFVTNQRALILRLFADSGCRSLRVLRHVLRDLGRIRNLLSDKHLATSSAVTDIVSVFCARDIEFRSGCIDDGDLRDTSDKSYEFMFEAQAESGTKNNPSRITRSEEKFPLVNFQSDIFNIEVMFDMIVKGRFVEEDILASINASLHFQYPDSLPPWKVIVQFEDFEDVIVERAIERMKKQLQDYEVTYIGEILHVFSLMMTLSDNKIIDEDISDIVSLGKSYVNYLTRHNELSTVDEQAIRIGRISHAYEGYVYHVPDSALQQFEELKESIFAANRTANQRHLPQAAEELLRLMVDDADQFLEQICHTNSEHQNPFASVPILMHVDPARFVESWKRSPVRKWRTITTALDIRYEYLPQQSRLNDERDWAIRFYRSLKREAQAADGLTAWRLRRAIPKALEVLAGDADISEPRS